MRFDIVRQPLLAAIFTMLLLAAAGLVRSGGPPPEPDGGLLLPGALLQRLQSAAPLATRLLCVAVLFGGGLVLGRTSVRCALYPTHTYIAMPLYGLCAALLLPGDDCAVQCTASLLLILGVRNLYASCRNGYSFDPLFRGAFWLGLLPLVLAPTLPLVVLVPAALILFKRSAREACVALFGLLLPFAACSYGYWLAGEPPGACGEALREALLHPSGWSPLLLPTPTLGLVGALFLFALWAAADYLGSLRSLGSRPRATALFNLLLFAVAAPLGALPSATPALAGVLAVPLALLVPLPLTRIAAPVASLLCLGAAAFALVLRFA